MQEFLSEYGKIILIVLVVLALIAIVLIFKDPMKNAFASLFNNFFASSTGSAGMSPVPSITP